MKKLAIILIMGIGLIFTLPKAQAQAPMYSTNVNAIIPTLDTVVNTGVKTVTSKAVRGIQNQITVSAKVAVLTGTAGGVLRLYGSLDNVIFHRITASNLRGNSVAPVDSLVVGVNTLQKVWVIEKSPFQYYQVQATGAGTVSFTIFGNYVAH